MDIKDSFKNKKKAEEQEEDKANDSNDNDDDDDDQQFKSISFEDLLERQKLKRKRPNSNHSTTNECYACKHDLVTNTNSNNNNVFDGFWRILTDNLGMIDFDIIIELMHEYFQVKIQQPAKEHNIFLLTEHDKTGLTINKKFDVVFSKSAIREHLLYHMNEPLIEYYVQLQQYKNLRDMFLDHAIQYSNLSISKKKKNGDTGTLMFDLKLLDKVDKVNAKILSLYKEKPYDALFMNKKINLV